MIVKFAEMGFFLKRYLNNIMENVARSGATGLKGNENI